MHSQVNNPNLFSGSSNKAILSHPPVCHPNPEGTGTLWHLDERQQALMYHCCKHICVRRRSKNSRSPKKGEAGAEWCVTHDFYPENWHRKPLQNPTKQFLCPNLTYHHQYYPKWLIVTCTLLVWMRPEHLHVAHSNEGKGKGLPGASMCLWMRQSMTIRWPVWESANFVQRNLTGLCSSTLWLWDFLINHSVQSYVFP